MSLDLTDARAAAEAYLLPDIGTIVRAGQPTSNGRGSANPGPETRATTPCGVAPASGGEASADLVAVRGAYRINLPVAAEVAPGDVVEVLGHRFSIVWAPPAHGLSLLRTVGAKEIL